MSKARELMVSSRQRAGASLFRGAVLALGVMMAWSTAAYADDAEPSVTVEPDGTVQVSIPVDGSPASVHAALADPQSSVRLSSDVLSVDSKPRGNCDDLRIETRGITRPLVVHTERCRTSTGVREAMTSSDDFTEYASEWRVGETDGQTVVTLRTKAQPNMSVPKFLVLRNIRNGAVRSVMALKQLLSKKRE